MSYINYFVSLALMPLALVLSSLSAQAQGLAQSQTPPGFDNSVRSSATGTPAFKSGGTAADKPQAKGAGAVTRKSGASGTPAPVTGGAMRPAVPGVSPYATGDEDETNDLEVQRRTVNNSAATRNAQAANGTTPAMPGSSGPVNPQAPGAPASIPVHK